MHSLNRMQLWRSICWLAGTVSLLFAIGHRAMGQAVIGDKSSSHTRLTEAMGGGLHGYISMHVSPPANGFGFGVSFYSTIWPLLAQPLQSFQLGLPGTWVMPDNRGYEQPLCPHGTLARDQWPRRAPSYRDVFQTIEGGGGFWDSTKFPSGTPKYRMNGTPDCYNNEISSPGWSFYGTALPAHEMGLVQISNRLLVAPDGLTFQRGTNGEVFGTAWMALPMIDSDAAYHRQPTGDKSWTFFINSENFKGPVAFWIPDTWSAISKGYAAAAGRTLDARPGLMAGGAMEVNTVPYFSGSDSHGTLYSRIPKLLFPVDGSKTTVLMQDVQVYSDKALFKPMKALFHSNRPWSQASRTLTGRFNPEYADTPTCKAEPLKFDQHGVPLTGFDAFVETTMVGRSGSCSYGLKWKDSTGTFPEYFKQEGDKMLAVPASEVPAGTRLADQTFLPAIVGSSYVSSTGPDSVWSDPGPRSGPFTVELSDGSQVTYFWYRFIDQPSLQHLHLSQAEKAKLQKEVEWIQSNWPITGNYIAPPDRGTLATLDPVLIVSPPRGLEIGYVPIVTRQEPAPKIQR
ncbi:MAG: hypothetical protein ACP5E5_02310 [Acidobacteriaceae bacterium]